MWIVRLALRRPYTFVVASLLLLLLTPFVLMRRRRPTFFRPLIFLSSVSSGSTTGLTAKDIEQRMVYTDERALTTTVNNIEHIESTSYEWRGGRKSFFQPGIRRRWIRCAQYC